MMEKPLIKAMQATTFLGKSWDLDLVNQYHLRVIWLHIPSRPVKVPLRGWELNEFKLIRSEIRALSLLASESFLARPQVASTI